MRIGCLTAMITLAISGLAGCGGNSPAQQAEPFELVGKWLYLGPSDGPHTLMIGDGSMVYTDVAGKWSSRWRIRAYDNGLDHFQVDFESGSGTHLPVGQSMSGTYDLSGSLLSVQLANGLASYPKLQNAGTCTAESDGTPTPDCRLYVDQN
jgi:hypothetical protein